MADESSNTEESVHSTARGAGGSRKGHRIRLYHNKSRAGCQRCKERRVKCDEDVPICGACRRHGIPCVYEDTSHRSPRGSSMKNGMIVQGDQTQSTAQRRAEDSVCQNVLLADPGVRSLRSFELRLIHHYISNIAYSVRSAFSAYDSPLSQPQHFPSLFNLIISNENLLFGVMAVSATHLLLSEQDYQNKPSASTLDKAPSNSPSTSLPSEVSNPEVLRRAREDYMYLALTEQREAVANLSAANVNGVCLASMLIMTNEFASLVARNLEPYEPPMQWLQMGRGVGTVFDMAETKLNALDPSWSSHVLQVVDPKLEDLQASSDAMRRMGDVGQRLLTPTHLPGEDIHDKQVFEVYDYAVRYMGSVQKAVDDNKDKIVIAVRCMASPSWIPDAFVDFLAERRPRALAILAHIFSFVLSSQDVWWIRGVPKREINAIWNALPPEWRFLMPDLTSSKGSMTV